MNYIKSLRIDGYKKFRSFTIDFHEHMNILVGENEAGKSTILEAIRIVLNQQYRNADKSVLRDLFNTAMVKDFRANPTVDTLPYIVIELEMVLDPKQKNSEYFYGEVYGERRSQIEKYGIRFECRFDKVLGEGLDTLIEEGRIPYEYYALSWYTFANKAYQLVKHPLQFISIDSTYGATAPTFNYYNRALFNSKYDESTRTYARNTFRDRLDKVFDEIELPDIDEHRKFGVDGKKVVFDSILSVYEDSVALENRGSGTESLIKTHIALDRRNGLDVVLMEEPENHLCFSTLRKMLREIEARQSEAQIIVTTHSSMIACRLNLSNVLWIAGEMAQPLSSVNPNTAEFFVKSGDNSFLQLLLSNKVFLVEGPSEALLLPCFYKQVTRHSLEMDGVSIICCNGISYRRYLDIADATAKRIAVLTDNDKCEERISRAAEFNRTNPRQHIFMGPTISEWTWEICIHKSNVQALSKMIETKAGAKYLYDGDDYGPIIGKMLNNKVDTAYQMITCGTRFEIPKYVEDAIRWLNE